MRRDGVALAIVLLLLAVAWVLWIWALVDAVKQPPMAFQSTGVSRGATIVLLLFTGGIGAIYYHLRIRRKVSETARTLSATERRMRGPIR